MCVYRTSRPLVALGQPTLSSGGGWHSVSADRWQVLERRLGAGFLVWGRRGWSPDSWSEGGGGWGLDSWSEGGVVEHWVSCVDL